MRTVILEIKVVHRGSDDEAGRTEEERFLNLELGPRDRPAPPTAEILIQ